MTEWIISSCVLIVVVVLLRQLLKGHISLRLQYALWAIVLVRLLVPVQFGDSAMSVMNAVEHSQAYEVTTKTLDEAMVYSDTIRNTTLTIDEARQAGTGRLHRVEGYSVESGNSDLHTYTFVDSLSNVLPRVLRGIWYIGMAAAALCLLFSNVVFARRLKNSRKALETTGFPLPVYVSDAVETPCLFGLLRPAAYVTPEVAEHTAALRHVLAHELTHYRHLDHIWSLLRSVCLAVHWYNPLVWWAVKLSRQDAELACDEGTIHRIGEAERADYGRTLVGLTCTSHRMSKVMLNATTMTGSKKSIKERVVLIAKRPKTAVYTLIAVVLVAAVAVGCTFTGAEEKDKKPKNATLRCVEQGADDTVYELALSEEIRGVAVSVEQWVDGACVQSNSKQYAADVTKIGIRGDVVRGQEGIWTTGTMDVTIGAGQDDTLLASFDFPEGRRFSAMSFDAYSEVDCTTTITAGEEYILAVMLFAPPPDGAIYSAWNCEQFMEEPSLMEKPECMIIVRVQLLSEDPEQTVQRLPMQQTPPEAPTVPESATIEAEIDEQVKPQTPVLQSGEEIKVVLAAPTTDELVYEAFSVVFEFTDPLARPTCGYRIPQIQLAGEDVETANLEIVAFLTDVIQNASVSANSDSIPYYGDVTYSCWYGEETLSLIIRCYSGYDTSSDCDFYSYVFELATGKRLSDEEVVACGGMSYDEYLEAASAALGAAFWDLHGSLLLAEGSNEGWEMCLQHTLSEANAKSARPFLDESGRLCIAGKVATNSDAGAFGRYLRLTENELPPYYSETTYTHPREMLSFEDVLALLQSGDSTGGCIAHRWLFGTPGMLSYGSAFNNFLICHYDAPEAIDLAEFLQYWPNTYCLTADDAEEFAAVAAHENFPFPEWDTFEKMMVPVHKIPAAEVEAALQQYAGVSAAEVDSSGEYLIYLPEYDSYYNFTSDAIGSVFYCTGGELDGDTIRLYSEHGIGSMGVLELRQGSDGWYQIESHMLLMIN